MSYNLRYYFSYWGTKDIRTPNVCDAYEVQILEIDGTEPAEEIEAQENPVIINYNNTSDNKLQSIRGSDVELNLIATEDFQLEDLYTEDELHWLVIIYRNSSVIWQGFIIPDGCQESWSYTPYTIQVNAVDGLGLIKNLAYVQNDGNFWIGKQSFNTVIYNCLSRLGLPEIKVNSCVNIYEVAQTQGNGYDPLELTLVDAERFLKDDEFNPMDCQEVINSILKEWTACIIQSEGEFYIYRPNEAALSSTLVFRNYTDNVFTGTTSKDIGVVLGGFSEGVVFAPKYHTLTDQLKMIEKPFKNASMSYKYGVKMNLDEQLDNPDLSGASQGCGGDPVGRCDDVTIPGWTKTGTMYAGLWPTGGVIFYTIGATYPVTTNYYENDNVFAIGLGYKLKFKVDYENPNPSFSTDMNFTISFFDGLTAYYLQQDMTWDSVLPYADYISIRSEIGTGGNIELISDGVPSSGVITVRILAPSGTVNDIIYTNISANVFLPLEDGLVGEIHTATQTGNFTFVPDTIDVLNGDSSNSQFIGAMYLDDGVTLTEKWVRRGLPESILCEPYEAEKPFLRIAVEEIQRLYARPFIKFEGSVANYFNPLSLFSINLIDGVFMPVSLRYDTQANICKAVLARVSNEEIAMDYLEEPDYGETTKVAVQ